MCNAQEPKDMIISYSDGDVEVIPMSLVDSITFADSSSPTREKKKIVGWGDSLTAGDGGFGVSYLTALRDLLGTDSYSYVNCGVGGEDSRTIGARQGGNPMHIRDTVMVPADGTPVDITLVDQYGKIMKPLRQGGNTSVNPCYINGKKYVITYKTDSQTDYQIASEDQTTDVMVTPFSPVITNSMKVHRTPYCLILWIGQNGGYDDPQNLIQQYQNMIDYAGVDRYIIIGFHKGKVIENEKLQDFFGEHFLDWRTYVFTDALTDAGITPTEDDLRNMENGKCPPSIMRDETHLNAVGYTLLGKQVYKKFKSLGY